MSKEELVAFLNDMIDALNWRRVGLLSLLAALMVSMVIIFENRKTVFNRLFDSFPVETIPYPWNVSQDSKDELVKLTKRPIIGGVILTEVDLKKNRRIVKFWHVVDSALRLEVANQISTMLPIAFFDTDKKNNDQMLAILNNQFVCAPTKETILVRFIPNLDSSFPFTCRLAVPPFTGEFAGLISVILTKIPSPTEVDSLKIELTRVSVEMYLRDIQAKKQSR